jgi:Zn finger protein HypA/HybF involved in hydrogenase expression
MNLPVWLFIGAAACLGVMALTAVIAFLVLRRGSQAIGQRLQDVVQSASDAAKDNQGSRSRWSQADAGQIGQPVITIEMAACPACGGQNAVGAAACTYCGRQL